MTTSARTGKRFHVNPKSGETGSCGAKTDDGCPFGEANHASTAQDARKIFEARMEGSTFASKATVKGGDYRLIDASPRAFAREIGDAGRMMQYSDPVIVKEQIDALRNLGLLNDAQASIKFHNPTLAAALANDQEAYVDYERMYETPEEYSYEGADGGLYRSQTVTWVGKLHYELQTVALNSLMRKLEHETITSDDVKSLKYLGKLKRSSNYTQSIMQGFFGRSKWLTLGSVSNQAMLILSTSLTISINI